MDLQDKACFIWRHREIEEPLEHVDPPQEKILTRGNLLGYEKLSKVQKDMGLQKRYTKRGKESGPALVMYPYYVTSLIKNLPTMKKKQRIKNGRML